MNKTTVLTRKSIPLCSDPAGHLWRVTWRDPQRNLIKVNCRNCHSGAHIKDLPIV